MNLFNTYQPCKELEDVVEHYWHSKCYLEQSLVQEMNTPTFQALTFNLSGQYEYIESREVSMRMDKMCYLIGQPLSKRVSISNPLGIDILGVKFKHLGIHLLTGIDMRHISDKIIDANNVWHHEIDLLYEEILDKKNIYERINTLEHFLKRKKAQQRFKEKISKDKTYIVKHSIHQMEANKTYDISKLREGVFTSKKTFERYFLNHIGVSPKQYATICRFNHVCSHLNELIEEPDWHDVIVSFGYYDQSHLIREFKRFAGKTPTEYFSLLTLSETEPENNLKKIFA